MFFTKKPVTIEAMPFERDRWEHLQQFTNGTAYNLGYGKYGKSICKIKTLEGAMTATEGDWIIKGVQGEFYACKPDIFAATYEPLCFTYHFFYRSAKGISIKEVTTIRRDDLLAIAEMKDKHPTITDYVFCETDKSKLQP